MQFAKGVTSGDAPFGGIGVSARMKDLMDSVPPGARWMHGLTNSGHPGCCAVALANLDVIEREDLIARAATLGQRLHDGLAPLQNHPNVGEVRGLGLMACAGIELVADRGTKSGFAAEAQIGKRVRAELFKRGLYTRILDHIIVLAPPFVTPENDIDRITEIVQETIPAALQA